MQGYGYDLSDSFYSPYEGFTTGYSRRNRENYYPDQAAAVAVADLTNAATAVADQVVAPPLNLGQKMGLAYGNVVKKLTPITKTFGPPKQTEIQKQEAVAYGAAMTARAAKIAADAVANGNPNGPQMAQNVAVAATATAEAAAEAEDVGFFGKVKESFSTHTLLWSAAALVAGTVVAGAGTHLLMKKKKKSSGAVRRGKRSTRKRK